MKKLFALILALIMLFSVTGCSEETEQAEKTEVTPARGTAENGIYENTAFQYRQRHSPRRRFDEDGGLG